MIMLYALLVAETAFVLAQDQHLSEDLWLGDLRRRNVVPMRNIERRWMAPIDGGGMNYRRSMNIRHDIVDRTFELTEAQIREAQMREARIRDAEIREAQIDEDKDKLDNIHRELRWLTMEAEDGGIGIGMEI